MWRPFPFDFGNPRAAERRDPPVMKDAVASPRSEIETVFFTTAEAAAFLRVAPKTSATKPPGERAEISVAAEWW